MRKILVRKCKYAIGPVSGDPLICDVYVLVDANGQMLWHENLFLSESAKTESINTLCAQACDLLSFTKMAEPLGGWKQINQNIITGYIHGELLQSRKYKYSTVNRHIETLKKFFHWLFEKGYTEHDKFSWSYRKCGQQGDSTAYHYSQHSLNKLYINSQEFDNLLTGITSRSPFIQNRDEIVLKLGYECGLRAHEVLKIEASFIHESIVDAKVKNLGIWATTKINLQGKGLKTREIYLPPNLCEHIYKFITRYRSIFQQRNCPLICSRSGAALNDPKFACRIFSEVCKNLNIVRFEHQGYHRLRKSFGTNLVNDCYRRQVDPWVEVPRRLGHSDISTTIKYIQFDALLNDRSEVLTSLKMRDHKYAAIH